VINSTKTNITQLGTEAFWIITGQLVAIIVSLIGVRILTSLMRPAEYGMLALLVSFATAFQYMPGLAISDTAMRFYTISFSTGRLIEYRSLLVRIFIVFTLIVSVVVLIGIGFAEFAFHELVNWIIPAGIFAIASVGYLLSIGILNGARARREVAVIQSFFQASRFILACFLVWFFSSLVFWAMWGFAIGALLTACIGYWLLTKYIITDLNKNEKASTNLYSEMLGYGWPLLITGVLTWATFFVDRWALGVFGTAEDIGKYFALYQVGFFPALLGAQTLRHFISPIMFHRLSQAKNQTESDQVYRINLITAHCILIFFIIVFIITLFTHELFFSILVGESYRAVSNLWPYMILAGGISISSSGLLISMFANMHTKIMIPIKLITTAVITVCVAIGAKMYGIDGVVYGILVFSILEFAITELFVLKYVHKKY